VAGHFLSAKFYYSKPEIEYDLEATNRLYACIKRLMSSKVFEQNILTELHLYNSGSRLFGDDFAKELWKTATPCETLECFLSCVKI